MDYLDHPIFNGVARHLKIKFREYHKDNPDVLMVFRQFAEDIRSKGFRRYSAQSLFEVIRWHYAMADAGRVFKLNNNYCAFYARLLHLEDKKWEDFFQLRCSKGQIEEAAYD